MISAESVVTADI